MYIKESRKHESLEALLKHNTSNRKMKTDSFLIILSAIICNQVACCPSSKNKDLQGVNKNNGHPLPKKGDSRDFLCAVIEEAHHLPRSDFQK